MAVHAVVFDFFGTLTKAVSARMWEDHVRRLALRLDVPPQAMTAVMVSSWPEVAVGSLGDATGALAVQAHRLGARPTQEQLAAAAAERMLIQRGLCALRDDVGATLEALRERGMRIGVLSDCSAELPEIWPGLECAPYVDAPVFSCVEGAKKPDARLFATVAKRLGVRAAECLYVGDGGSRELDAATVAGMTAVLLDAHDRDDDWAYERQETWAGERVSTVTDVLSLLDRLESVA